MKKILGNLFRIGNISRKDEEILNKLEDALGHAINYSIDEQFQNILRCTSVTALVQLTKKKVIPGYQNIFKYLGIL